jgi:hypothetical protein
MGLTEVNIPPLLDLESIPRRKLSRFSFPQEDSKIFCGTKTSRKRQSSEVWASGGRMLRLNFADEVGFARVATGVPSRNCSTVDSQPRRLSICQRFTWYKTYLDLLEDNYVPVGHHWWFDWCHSVGWEARSEGSQWVISRIWCCWNCSSCMLNSWSG